MILCVKSKGTSNTINTMTNESIKQTRPGINNQVNLEALSKEEKEIIKLLAKKYWYITRIENQENDRSSYRVVFLKPVNFITQSFNLTREIVMILSPYSSFEPRALDVLDQLDAQLLRLEEICCFVASKDPNIESALRSFMQSNTESRVVVPFTYEDLINSHDDEYVINQMRRFFYSRDLFGIQEALKKELYFFGRRDLIQELVNKHANNENAGIFGLRKTGKTSIIYGVIRALDRKKSFSLLVDCQTLHLQSWNIAIQTIVWKVIEGLQIKQTQFIENKEKYNNTSEAAIVFEKDFCNILRIAKKDILLIFDEIENITFDTSISEEWRSGQSFVKFWQIIRSFCQHNPTKYHFSFIIAGTNPRCVETPTINKVDNPLFSQFSPIYISPFSFDATEEMLNRLGGYMGIHFDKQTISAFVGDFGGHPLLMRQMASYIHRNVKTARPLSIGKFEYEEYKRSFYQDETGFSQYAIMILQVLEDWYKEEYEMLKYLAQNDIEAFKEFAEVDVFIKHLKSYGIIEKDNTLDGYHFKIEALGDYLSGKLKFSKKATTQEEKETEIQKRRSRIEKNLRTLVKRQLKSSLGETTAKEEIIRAIYGAKEVGHKSNLPYSDFFDPKKHLLYLKTLFDVIERNYTAFEKLFEVKLDEFKSKANLLNIYRRTDAHTTPISEDDFSIFRGVASWFEKMLSEE